MMQLPLALGEAIMIAMQYAIGLPADYDMGIIRRRVAERGAAFDGLPGLHFKAFLIRERSRGQVGNEYAPFYVWSNIDSLWDFVAGNGFKGIVDSFGWQPIRTWLPLAVTTRSGLGLGEVKSATREELYISPGTDLMNFRRTEVAENTAALESERLIGARVVAVDTEHWRVVRFALWLCDQNQIPPEPARDRFEVLRLSAPGLALIDSSSDEQSR
jgi:hypothetical protein